MMPADKRFPPSRRLLTKKDFDAVFREGQKCIRPSLVVFIRQREEGATESRLGLAVSLKVTRKAIHRNRLRRRLREAFRNNQDKIPTPSDIVLIARHGSTDASYGDLEKQYLSAIEKAARTPRP